MTEQANSKLFSTRNLVLLGVFTAIILLFSFTPLGYLKVGLVSITFIMIPVVIGSIVIGPAGGAILGCVFGLTSYVQCFGMDMFGTTLCAISPVSMAITCVLTRTLMGWLAGLIFRAIHRIDKTRILSYGAACLSGALLNTIFFIGSLLLFFGQSEPIRALQESIGGGTVWGLIVGMVGVNGVVEAAVCFIVGTAIAKALDALISRRRK